MLKKNFLSNKSCDFFEKLLIQTILSELNWHSVVEYFLYFIHTEDKYHDIQLISNLSQLLSLFLNKDLLDRSLDEKSQLNDFFQLLLTFLNQTSDINRSISSNIELYVPPLSPENQLDHLRFLIDKILRHIK